MNGQFRSVEQQLFKEGHGFDFFQAVRLLEKLFPDRTNIGRYGPPHKELVRFRAFASFSFPASEIFDIERPAAETPFPVMIVTFMGLTGPNGILPRHYTQWLLQLDNDSKHADPHALRDWFNIFDHRFISLFYRAWEKYRFYIAFERGEYSREEEADPFTRCLFSLIGLGGKSFRNRLQVFQKKQTHQVILARIEDLALLYYSGFLAHRPRNASGLQAFLQDFFQLPFRLQQFRGQWLVLDRTNQSRIGIPHGNSQLGTNMVAGERVWDVQSKFRIILGPLGISQFTEFLPDRSPYPPRKSFFLLVHLVRFYVGPEFDFDIQLVLKAEDIRGCQMRAEEGGGPQLGWNTWIACQDFTEDSEDVVFEGEEIFQVNGTDAR